jgi:antitoxin FitA
MANVLIRDLPEEVHMALRQRAQGRGQSLQAYLIAELRRLSERPSLGDVLDRINERQGGRVGLQQAVGDLSEERGRQ